MRKVVQVHGGSEIVMFCVKHMTEESVEEFVKNTDEIELAQGLQKDRDDHLGGYSKIDRGFDEDKGSHFVEVIFYMEIEDMENVESWCEAEGFDNVKSIFGGK
ncbi:MAG: hypothetical protein QGG98_06075 [Pseudomonadales bacterium]|jgi:hypothetical protein|nr:hypothetical protein [Pseudomonadales bacterium]MDP7359755.1 hypothetical protein [Pseudomonadales bacterium]